MRLPRFPRAFSSILVGLIVPAVLLIPNAALAQVTIDPTATPTRNDGGWVYWMAYGAIVLGVLILVFAVAMYLRFAPRFFREREEEHEGPRAGVKAPPTTAIRMQWRPPPPAPVAAPAGVAAAPAAAAPAPTPAPAAAPAPAPARAPAAQAAPAAQPAAQPEPAAEAPKPAAPAAPRHEGPIELDQETFDKVLKEQLDKGTDRRVAEGRARSAALKAAREKAGE